MKVVIAPDKFKGCLDAGGVAQAIAAGVRAADSSIEIDECPMADGGEGTVEALVTATGGRFIRRRVTGPLPDTVVDATFGMLGDGTTAVIEMSAASGLHLLRPEQRDPMRTTTRGTGELLMAAVEAGAKRIILGIGGSATVDGGVGCARACGIDENNRWREDVPITVACDVTNPLYGPNGAARVFGPQKGATPAQVEQLDQMLRSLSQLMGRDDLAQIPGAGAAGGLGFGMMAYFGATLKPGIEIVIDAVRLRDRLKNADLCITGEGKLDIQSLAGKTAVGVARVCKSLSVPCIALVGAVDDGAEQSLAEGITAYFSICDRPMSLEDAMRRAPELLTTTAANAVRAISSASRPPRRP